MLTRQLFYQRKTKGAKVRNIKGAVAVGALVAVAVFVVFSFFFGARNNHYRESHTERPVNATN